jgi:hypothetical protein
LIGDGPNGAAAVPIAIAASQTGSEQEIHDGQGKLVDIHEKHPVDKGHQKQ